MEIRGFRHLALSFVLCFMGMMIGCCSHYTKDGKHRGEYGASTQGAGEGSGFAGEEGDLLSKRTIYFDFDRSDINEQDYPVIHAHAHFLKEHSGRHIRVEGHTDEQGSREYNIGLGERRARTVANALISQGVSRHQVSTVSYGKQKPAAEGNDEAAYRANRRAVIVYEDR